MSEVKAGSRKKQSGSYNEASSPLSSNKQVKVLVDDEKQFVSSIDAEIGDILSRRSDWEKRQVRWYKERYGIRGKKNFPFPGCSNMHIPLIDMQIKKLLPAYINLLWGSANVAEFKVLPHADKGEMLRKEAAYNTHILNHLIKDRMDKSFEKTVMWTDRMLQSGFCIIKVTYDYCTEGKEYSFSVKDDLNNNQRNLLISLLERNDAHVFKDVQGFLAGVFRKKGAHIDEDNEKHLSALQKCTVDVLKGRKKSRLKIDEVSGHYPKWSVVKPQDFIIDGAYNDLQEAPLVCHRMYYTENALRQMAADGVFGKSGKDNVAEIIKSANGTEDSSYDGAASVLSGVKKDTCGSLIEVREVHCFAPVDKSGILKRCTLYYSPVRPDKVLKFVRLPYEDNKIPFVKVSMEIKDDGFYASRGIPAMLDYLATMVNVRHNQRVDNLTIANSPMIKYIPGQVTMSNVRYIPGQGIPVKDMNALQPVVLNPGNNAAFLEEERLLRGYIENYVASPDFNLTDSTLNPNQPRKATEVLQIAQQRKDMFSVDSRIYLSAVKELLEMTWSRWIQYGSRDYELKIKGEHNPVHWERKTGQPLKIYPKGTLQDVNPVIKMQKARQWLSVLGDPIIGKFYDAKEIADYIAASIDNEKSDRFMLDEDTVNQKDQQKRKALLALELEKLKKAAELSKQKQEDKIKEIETKELLKRESAKKKIELEEEKQTNAIREKAKADLLKEIVKQD